MAECILSFNFSTSFTGGTAPFKTSIDVEVPTAGDYNTFGNTVEDWWDAATTFRGYLSSSMGAPLVTLTGVFAGIVVEDAWQFANAPTGSAPDLPGASLRVIKLGNRPAGGRRGSMYWPGVSGSITQATGAVDSTPRTNVNAALTQLATDLDTDIPGCYFLQRHSVDGDESTTAVTGFSTAATLSWLQRRYR